MKSVLFLITLSICASCCLFAEEPVQPQVTAIEELEEANLSQTLTQAQEQEELACKCGREGCPGCDSLGCGNCKSIIKDSSEELAGCGCKDKNKGKTEIASTYQPKSAAAATEAAFACECEMVKTQNDNA